MCGCGLSDRVHAVAVAVSAARRWYTTSVRVVIVDAVQGVGGVRRASASAWAAVASDDVIVVEVAMSLPPNPRVFDCPPAALTTLLQHTSTPVVLLLRQPLALTWQHALPFLARVALGSLGGDDVTAGAATSKWNGEDGADCCGPR